MATQAQCAYCFECIAARLERRKRLGLAQVEELWNVYENGGEDEEDEEKSAAQLHADGRQTNGVEGDDDSEDKHAADGHKTSPYRPAAISRLLNPSPSSASSSSIPSAASSTPSLSSDASAASSRTSLFSLPKRFSRSKRDADNAASTAMATTVDLDDEEYPLFVTWNKVSSKGHKQLAGCIGTFEPYPLEEGLRIYSETSAFDDSRFDALTARDLPILSCSITLLMHFEAIADPMDWSIGTHGLRISFTHQGRRLGATYLPDVAREQGWTKEETIISLMRKAGWGGRSSEWRGVKDLSCVRYQGLKASLGYREWKEWRTWVEETGREEDGMDI